MSKTATVKRDEQPQGKPTRCQDVSGSPFTAHNCFLISCGAPLKHELLRTIKNKRSGCSTMCCARSRLMWRRPRVHGGSGTWAVWVNGGKHWVSKSFWQTKKRWRGSYSSWEEESCLLWCGGNASHSRSVALVISPGKQRTRKRVNLSLMSFLFFFFCKNDI